VLAAPTEPEGVGANTLKNLVRHIGELELYDYVLIDAPAGLGEGFRMAARAAESGIIVATSDPICLRTSEKTAAALRDCGVMDIKLVVNRVRPVLIGYGLPNIDDAMDAAGVGLLGYIPEDEGVIVAGAMGIPVIKTPSGAAARAYRNIARRICGENIPLMKVKRR
jgi:septum site-determining protein MinD